VFRHRVSECQRNKNNCSAAKPTRFGFRCWTSSPGSRVATIKKWHFNYVVPKQRSLQKRRHHFGKFGCRHSQCHKCNDSMPKPQQRKARSCTFDSTHIEHQLCIGTEQGAQWSGSWSHRTPRSWGTGCQSSTSSHCPFQCTCP